MNEKGMVPKDKGVGDVKPWFMGEKLMRYHLVCLPPFLVSPNRFDVLMEVVGAVIVLGVGWQDY